MNPNPNTQGADLARADDQSAPDEATTRPRFTFREYNTRRAARGAEAVRMEVCWPDGGVELLWMTKRDVARNITSFGVCDELAKARAAYKEASHV